MGSTTFSTSHALTAKQWATINDGAFREYVDKLVLKSYMGMSPEAMIHVREELSKQKGDRVTLPLAYALNGDGVTSGATMEGSEESMQFFGYNLSLEEYRNAVKDDGSMSRQRTAFDLANEFRPALTTWMAQKVEQKAFEAFASIDGVAYGAATETQKDTWLTANADRMLFGAAVVNGVSNDHSTALATIDTTTDILNVAQISLAKRIAQLASPKIRPIRIENGEEYFVLFVHPYCARDLKNTSTWQAAQQYARERGADNPLFTGMLGMWDGVIIKEANKCLLLDNVGDTSSDVAANFLCGAQALGMVQSNYPENGGSRVVLTEKMFDYDTQMGIQIKGLWNVGKCVFNSKQHGVVTVYSSAVAD